MIHNDRASSNRYKPGPQPHNQIGTFAEQLRRVFGPAGAPQWSGCSNLCPPLPPPEPEPLSEAETQRILDALAPAIAHIAGEIVRGLLAQQWRMRNHADEAA
jgi:hypothetical protein